MVTKHRADLPVLCGCFPLAIYFTFGSVYMSMLLSHFVPASPSPAGGFLTTAPPGKSLIASFLSSHVRVKIRALPYTLLTHRTGFPLCLELGLLSVSYPKPQVWQSFLSPPFFFQYQGHVLWGSAVATVCSWLDALPAQTRSQPVCLYSQPPQMGCGGLLPGIFRLR